jgi:3,4-dihydroxy 2-butanone 4-phosphate synthase/GTP cyclohydrolase II
MTDYLKFLGSQTVLNSKKWGKLKVESASFTPASDGDMVVYIGEPLKEERPLVRIHSECVFAEVFDSDFCDCADQLSLAMDTLKCEKNGILFYLRFDGRGAGLSAKIKATSLEMDGKDTFESRVEIGVAPEGRDFSNIALFLLDKGVKKITLLTNNPIKLSDLENNGIDVKIKSLIIDNPNKNVEKLYQTKVNKFNHTISGY